MRLEHENSSVPACRHANHTIIGTDSTSKSARLVFKEKNLNCVKRWYVATTLGVCCNNLGSRGCVAKSGFLKKCGQSRLQNLSFFLKKRYTKLLKIRRKNTNTRLMRGATGLSLISATARMTMSVVRMKTIGCRHKHC
jgi:hypothetical protein